MGCHVDTGWRRRQEEELDGMREVQLREDKQEDSRNLQEVGLWDLLIDLMTDSQRTGLLLTPWLPPPRNKCVVCPSCPGPQVCCVSGRPASFCPGVATAVYPCLGEGRPGGDKKSDTPTELKLWWVFFFFPMWRTKVSFCTPVLLVMKVGPRLSPWRAGDHIVG